jgi:phosphoribosyl-ATP pyrophosphohydrolase/phosphoribosyl-AMP cyclohydrolase
MSTTGHLEPAAVRWGADGLVPAVVQGAGDGRVLMVAWMDAEALEATQTTGLVHFRSRSRAELWQKGASSGNVLRLRSLALDCDADTLLVTAEPAGPACHRGTDTCFDPEPGTGAAPAGEQGFHWLEVLWATIVTRAADRPEGSYTASLVSGGPDRVGRKVAEEATEVLIAAKNDAVRATASPSDARSRDETRDALAGEAADLLYHLLVLLAERGLEPSAILETLRRRHRS